MRGLDDYPPHVILIGNSNTNQYFSPDLANWPPRRDSNEQSEDQMQSVRTLPYQTGKLSPPAFQNGEAQDEQTKIAELSNRNVAAEAMF